MLCSAWVRAVAAPGRNSCGYWRRSSSGPRVAHSERGPIDDDLEEPAGGTSITLGRSWGLERVRGAGDEANMSMTSINTGHAQWALQRAGD